MQLLLSAFFTGVGYKTTMGMGQTRRRTPVDNRPDSHCRCKGLCVIESRRHDFWQEMVIQYLLNRPRAWFRQDAVRQTSLVKEP